MLFDDIVCIEEVRNAEFFAGDLFRRIFHSDPPNYGRHFIALYRDATGQFLSVGYIHFTAFEDMFLVGGMVVDKRTYRRIPAIDRKIIRDAGGIAEWLLRHTIARFPEAPAVWGHVGDKLAYDVDFRVGFRPTAHRHVIAMWKHELPESEKAARAQRVALLGPF